MNKIAPELLAKLTRLRHKLHAQPEAAFEETKTAAEIVGWLQACGVDEIHQGIGKTGVVALLKGNRVGRMIALRAPCSWRKKILKVS